jgi:hypothetical protein
MTKSQLVGAIGAVVEGFGIRARARVFEVAPNTVRSWLVVAAKHLGAFSRDFLRDVAGQQVQTDELFAPLRAVKGGAIPKVQAIQPLARFHLTGDGWQWSRPPSSSIKGGNPRCPIAASRVITRSQGVSEADIK